MKEILIDKQIGETWFDEGITADFVRDELQAAGKDDIRITIDSPGGDVFDCISIYNVIRDFCRNHSNKVTTYIRGLAASAASVIALAASDTDKENKILIESNSVFMIHNGLTFCQGNRHDLRSCADRLEKIADRMMIGVYTKRTGKSEKEIEKDMDAETWLCGQEIIDAGFADSFIEEPDTVDESLKEAFVAVAKNSFNSMKMAAQINLYQRMRMSANSNTEIPGGGKAATGKNIIGGCKMTAEELKKNNPEVYAAIVAEGRAEGVKLEQERASRLLAMGDKCNAMKLALECIKENKSPTDADVVDAFMDAKVATNILSAQKKDEAGIPEVNPPKDTMNAGRDNAAVMAAFDKEMGGSL
ncbi:MAG: Clp protease ClpP [Treponema sp.]|nr:Clp protease ClpP [Treponema sp.]